MPDEKQVQEIYDQMMDHQQEISAIDSKGNTRNSLFLAAAYIVAAIEGKSSAE